MAMLRRKKKEVVSGYKNWNLLKILTKSCLKSLSAVLYGILMNRAFERILSTFILPTFLGSSEFCLDIKFISTLFEMNISQNNLVGTVYDF